MKTRILALAASVGMLSLVACDSSDEKGADVVVNSDSAAVETIAGDKAQVARVLRRAHEKGTFDDAMAIVMQDSALAGELAALVRDDPRFAVAGGTAPQRVASTGATTASKTTRPRTSTSSTTTARKGDVLDQTEASVKKANERLDQAARVKREAEEAKKKVDDILGRR
jgi:hypothetical protein